MVNFLNKPFYKFWMEETRAIPRYGWQKYLKYLKKSTEFVSVTPSLIQFREMYFYQPYFIKIPLLQKS